MLLATPSLAHFLDLDAFLKPVIERLYQGPQIRDNAAHELNIRSISAVVDALPAAKTAKVDGRAATAEGLSFLMSSASYNGMGEYAAPAAAAGDNDGPATLQFVSGNTSSSLTQSTRRVIRSLTLPVANTLFVNGQRTTLLEDHWNVKILDAKPVVEHRGRRPLKNYRISLGCAADGFLDGHVPLQSLTPRRTISSCMGNVLARIEIEGRAVPASQELEKTIPEYIKSHPERASRGPLLVYALVRSPGKPSSENVEMKKDGEPASPVLSGLWRGARLYKVTGGGGGWGQKQGLLSLETAIDFESRGSTLQFPDPDQDEVMPFEMASQDMIPAGSTVEFLVNTDDEVPTPESTFSDPKERPHVQRHSTSTWVLGTASDLENRIHHGSVANSEVPGAVFLPGRFGMVSYGGAALASDEMPAAKERFSPTSSPFESSRTRLDVPDSRFILTNKHRHIKPLLA